jgi:threonine/homoserine/homoserine lactone efflux protein
MSLEFLVTALVMAAVPGTGVLYTISIGLSRGARASIAAAAGCTLGILPHVAAAVTGLAALLQASPTAFEVLKFLGVAYLLYMAWRIQRDKQAFEVKESAPRSTRRIIGSGIALNVLNPKLTIFFVALLPQFIKAGQASQVSYLIDLSVAFMLITFVVFVGYGWFAGAMRDHVASNPRVSTWVRYLFAAGFVALAAVLMMGDR